MPPVEPSIPLETSRSPAADAYYEAATEYFKEAKEYAKEARKYYSRLNQNYTAAEEQYVFNSAYEEIHRVDNTTGRRNSW